MLGVSNFVQFSTRSHQGTAIPTPSRLNELCMSMLRLCFDFYHEERQSSFRGLGVKWKSGNKIVVASQEALQSILVFACFTFSQQKSMSSVTAALSLFPTLNNPSVQIMGNHKLPYHRPPANDPVNRRPNAFCCVRASIIFQRLLRAMIKRASSAWAMENRCVMSDGMIPAADLTSKIGG